MNKTLLSTQALSILKYVVTYTKDLTQKRKRWVDGVYTLNQSTLLGELYEINDENVATGRLGVRKYNNVNEFPTIGDELRVEHFLVYIDSEENDHNNDQSVQITNHLNIKRPQNQIHHLSQIQKVKKKFVPLRPKNINHITQTQNNHQNSDQKEYYNQHKQGYHNYTNVFINQPVISEAFPQLPNQQHLHKVEENKPIISITNLLRKNKNNKLHFLKEKTPENKHIASQISNPKIVQSQVSPLSGSGALFEDLLSSWNLEKSEQKNKENVPTNIGPDKPFQNKDSTSIVQIVQPKEEPQQVPVSKITNKADIIENIQTTVKNQTPSSALSINENKAPSKSSKKRKSSQISKISSNPKKMKLEEKCKMLYQKMKSKNSTTPEQMQKNEEHLLSIENTNKKYSQSDIFSTGCLLDEQSLSIVDNLIASSPTSECRIKNEIINIESMSSFNDLNLSEWISSNSDALIQLPNRFKNRSQYCNYFLNALCQNMVLAIKDSFSQNLFIKEAKIIMSSQSFSSYLSQGNYANFCSLQKTQPQKLTSKKNRLQSDNYKQELEETKDNQLMNDYYIKFLNPPSESLMKESQIDDLWIIIPLDKEYKELNPQEIKKKRKTSSSGGKSTNEKSEALKLIYDSKHSKKGKNRIICMRANWRSISTQRSMVNASAIGNFELQNEQILKIMRAPYLVAIKSINLGGFIQCIDNLLKFSKESADYSMEMIERILHIGKLKPIEQTFCKRKISKGELKLLVNDIIAGFHLNSDQQIVIHECAKWFLRQEDIQSLQNQNLNENGHPLFFDEKNRTSLLVHGVFGSGKSMLLVALIILFTNIFNKINDQDSKILISSLTNIAVDGILLGLLNREFTDFGRVGSVKKINKLLLPFSHYNSKNFQSDEKEQIKDLRKMLREIQVHIDQAPKNNEVSVEKLMKEKWSIQETIKNLQTLSLKKRIEILRAKRVIGVTCAATAFEVLENCKFGILILDEASQMIEPQSLLAISKFKIEKMIAVGDPLQLPPIVAYEYSSINENTTQTFLTEDQNLQKPLFLRLQQNHELTILLRTQYRCHPKIANISNYLFYDGKLQNGITQSDRKSLISGFGPVNFIEVSGKEIQDPITNSYKNYKEAYFLLEFYLNIISKLGNEQISTTIGAIVLYKAQEELINHLIEKHPNKDILKDLKVSTVDAFQGCEKDIIIVSCVRTNKLGFIDDGRRLNVAITRAKFHLFVLGDGYNLGKSKLWNYIIQISKQNGFSFSHRTLRFGNTNIKNSFHND